MNDSTVTLTTDHAASSYGMPVLVVDGEAYGSLDILPNGDYAVEWVMRWRLEPDRTAEELEAAAAFMRQGGIEPAPGFAYYTAEGMWSTGRTPEEAIERFIADGLLSDDEVDRDTMKTAPMTPRLAERVEAHGFNCKYDSYTITADGRLDLEPDDTAP